MIIPNGHLAVKRKTASGIDPETGHPVRSSGEYVGAIPCQYAAVHYNALGTTHGEHFTPSAYTVLIDEQPFDGEQVRLTDRNGRRIGDFSVQRIEPLEAVCQIRLWI